MADLLAELDGAYGVKTAGGAGDLLKAVGRAAPAVGRAASGYVSRLAGYGPRGPLQGQKLFDSSTVPVPLARAEIRPDITMPWAKALDPVADRVARLPVPGAGVLADAVVPPRRLPDPRNLLDAFDNAGRRAVYAADRRPLFHPVVQTVRTVGRVLGTPITVPPLQAAADAAEAAGRTGLATALNAAAKTNQAAGQVVRYASLGIGAHHVQRQLRARVEAAGIDPDNAEGRQMASRIYTADPTQFVRLALNPPVPPPLDHLRSAVRRTTVAGNLIGSSSSAATDRGE